MPYRIFSTLLAILAFGHWAFGGGDLDPVEMAHWPSPSEALPTSILDFVIKDNHAYAATGEAGLVVLDVTDPMFISKVNTVSVDGFLIHLALMDDLLLAVSFDGMEIFDVSMPAEPRKVGEYASLGFRSIAAVGTRGQEVFLVGTSLSRRGRMEIVDLTVPEDPQRIRLFSPAESAQCNGFALHGSMAVIGNTGGKWVKDDDEPWGITNAFHFMTVLDITDAATPQTLATIKNTYSGHKLTFCGDQLYAYSSAFDLSDPHSPTPRTSPLPRGAIMVCGDGILYAADFPQGLTVWEMSETGDLHPLADGVNESWQPSKLVVEGQTLFVGTHDRGLVVFDVSDPRNPRKLPSAGTPAVNVRDVAVSKGYAYLADHAQGLIVLDVSNPRRPRQVNLLPPGESRSLRLVEVAGNYVYTVATDGRVSVIDVHDPAKPIEVGSLEREVGWQGDDDFTLSGNHLFITSGEIIDISEAENPKLVGRMEPGARSIQVRGNYAFLGAGWGMTIVDISKLSEPRTGSTLRMGLPRASAMAIVGDSAYLSYEDERDVCLAIVDISDLEKPRLVGTHYDYELDPLRNDPRIAVRGNQLIITDGNNLLTLDASDPVNLRQAALFRGGGSDLGDGLAINDGSVFLARGSDGLSIIDAFRAASVAPTAHYEFPDDDWETGSIAIEGDHAYLAKGNHMEILKLTGVREPRRVSTLSLTRSSHRAGISVRHPYVYWASEQHVPEQHVLSIVDVMDPSEPREIGSYKSTSRYIHAFKVIGTTGYISFAGRFEIIDLSVAENPVKLGDIEVHGESIELSGNYAFLGGTGGTVSVIDVANPEQPFQIGGYSEPTIGPWIEDLKVVGQHLILVANDKNDWNGSADMVVLDVSNPEAPELVNRMELEGRDYQHRGMALIGNRLYLSNAGRISVFDVTNPTNIRRIGGSSAFHELGGTFAANDSHLVVAYEDRYEPMCCSGRKYLAVLHPHQDLPLHLGLRDDSAGMILRGPVDERVLVQRSGNLSEWEDWSEVVLEGGRADVFDPDESPEHFYRATLLPQ